MAMEIGVPSQSKLDSLRCGKSCRLRWINYLRPDVKRGKFTLEEEETIIKLHEMLGNRWSAIAARLPGRTDNEIKNVWHTHLKKRLNKNSHNHKSVTKTDFSAKQHPTWSSTNANYVTDQLEATTSTSSKPSSSDFSSVTETTSLGGEETSNNNNDDKVIVIKDEKYTENQFVESTDFPEIDESFWSDHALSVEISNATPSPSEFSCPFFSSNTNSVELDYDYGTNNLIGCDMDFWHCIFVEAGGSPMLPEF